jgi:hypothetical protein
MSIADDEPMTPEEIGYYLLIVAQHAGVGGRVACEDPTLLAFLASEGLDPDPASRVAWAANLDQTRRFASEGKLVVCGDAGLFPGGASFAIVRSQGRTVVLLDQDHAAHTGILLPKVLLTLSRPA